jgi:hypothetical protein
MMASEHGASWESQRTVRSQSHPNVEFVIAKMTFGRRLDLMRRVRDLAACLEFFQAGREAKHEMEATVLGAEIDRIYINWGVKEVRGLQIDGLAATPETLIDAGPEELFNEALAAVKAECGLNEDERKN